MELPALRWLDHTDSTAPDLDSLAPSGFGPYGRPFSKAESAAEATA